MNIINDIKSPEELLKYMDNITYGFIDKNGKKHYDEWDNWYEECIIQNGEEVLKSNIGSCWDQVEFERLWFKENNYNFKTIFIWFELNRENNLPTHTFLIYEKDNKYYWFEHAFELYRGIKEFKSEKEAIKYVKEKQIEYVLNNKYSFNEKDIDCLKAYEYLKPLDHLKVEEYLKHVTTNKYED